MRLCQLVEVLQGLDLAGSTAAVLLHVGCGQGKTMEGSVTTPLLPEAGRAGYLPTTALSPTSLGTGSAVMKATDEVISRQPT